MTTHLPKVAAATMRWLAGGGDDEGEHGFGVHIEYEDLYDTILFFIAIYASGHIATFVKMPSLVGEIICGILLGPPLADFVPNPEAFVLLGEIGLVLLVVEAGIDIDVSTLKLIGTRGMMIAIVGSILPIGLGILIAMALFGTSDIKAAIAAGCSFGPTSLGIALNILRSGGVLNTPVGQLIVSAAVIDDMIALIVLSQLESLTGTIDAAGILIPVVSAVCFLCIGGYLALFVAPGIINKHVLTKVPEEHHGKIELAIMFGILVALMPATHYTKASYLMGAFVAGLTFCTSHELHVAFVRQFKRLLQWLMRIFFAASIGFQVPIKDLFQGHVLVQGLVFTIALLGKLAVGFMVPNFTQAKSFTKWHLRDCLITGFSMAAEGEFAFVIAVFSVENGLIDQDQYASVVLAVLLSTIIPPFLLRFTISYYNKKAEQELQDLANEEMDKNHRLEDDEAEITESQRENQLVDDIYRRRAVFLCIQTQSESAWGLMPRIMQKLSSLKLDIIDHRSWHPRGIDATLVNEIYVKDEIKLESKGEAQETLKKRINEVREALKDTIGQPETSKVKVQRWFPGVVQEIVESVHDRTKHKKSLSVQQQLVSEAAKQMDARQSIQTTATHERTVQEILADMGKVPGVPEGSAEATGTIEKTSDGGPKRRRRRKMRSTPAVGGDLFGGADAEADASPEKTDVSVLPGATTKKWKPDFDFGMKGQRAEIIVDGESFDVRLNAQAIKQLRAGFSGDMLDSRGIALDNVSVQSGDVTNMLSGYVRQNMSMSKIDEVDSESETSSIAAARKPEKMPPV